MSRKIHASVFTILTLFLVPVLIRTNTKNTCTSYLDYFLINFSTNCYYNPDVDLGVPELIKKYTGNLQSYNVTTEDGYILTVFRVFKQNPIGVILLQPPISAGSIAWTSDGNQSLAFTLWNMGYDVWLTNHRGASYSRKHVYLTDTDPQYWDYSFHEIATYDFEVQFELIRNETNNSRIIYVGYSMSATEALIYASLKPEEAQNFIKSFILIAPTSVMKHFISPFKYLLYLMSPFEKFLRLGEFMTFEAARWIADYLTFVPYIVNFFDSVIMGWTPDEMDPILYPYIFSHHGRGITNKMLYHYIQIIASGNRFLMYDYGNKTNTVLYGSGLPPDYPLERILAPVYIIYGEKDALATPLDIDTLCTKLLPSEIVQEKIQIPNCNHIDYLFSRYREKKTYQSIFLILNKIQNETFNVIH